MRLIHIEHTPTTFFLPADHLRAAFQCVSSEETRYYLRGVFVHQSDTGPKLVALDGHQMLIVALYDSVHIGAECATQDGGFILATDMTDKAFKTKTCGGDLWVYGDTTTGLLQFVSWDGKPVMPGKPLELARQAVCEFSQIDGTFPDYARVIAKGDGTSGAMTYDSSVMDKLVKAARVLHDGRTGPGMRLTSGATDGDPIQVEFVGLPRLLGTVMPMRWRQ